MAKIKTCLIVLITIIFILASDNLWAKHKKPVKIAKPKQHKHRIVAKPKPKVLPKPKQPVLPKPKAAEVIMTTASISKYVWTGNPMSNGEWPYIGAVATSNYWIPLGSTVFMNNRTYVVKDRTANWIQPTFGLTFDLYTNESVWECLLFGRRYWPVVITIK